jgi:hypothetical protein
VAFGPRLENVQILTQDRPSPLQQSGPNRRLQGGRPEAVA